MALEFRAVNMRLLPHSGVWRYGALGKISLLRVLRDRLRLELGENISHHLDMKIHLVGNILWDN